MAPHHRVGGDIHVSQPLSVCGCAGGFVGFSPTPLHPCGGRCHVGGGGGGVGFAATQPWPIMMHGGGARGGGPPQFFAGVGPQSMPLQQPQQIHYSVGPPNQYQ